ncbi:MAG: cytochrome c [Rhodocyclaceae bacterium]|nr:cytochrome c [Rhodocyclaceae bacterium]
MKKTTKTLLAGFALSVVAGTTLAQMKVEDAITFRQSGYKFMAWNMGKIKANVEGQYNKDQVAAAANVVAAIANSGMGALYIPGSDKGKGWHETNVKPELFTDKEGVGKVARAFNDAANEMARVAATGDAAAVKAQFGKLGETCKACHDKYRKEEH